MSGLRLVQAGAGDARDVVLIFHYTAELDAQIRAAVPGEALVCNATYEPFKGNYGRVSTLPTLVSQALALGKAKAAKRVIVCGFSEGCQASRTILNAGGDPDALVLADGTHAAIPVPDAQIAAWRSYAERAKHGERVFCASHTMLTYVETLGGGSAYASTWRVLKMVTAFPLASQGPPSAPAISRDGSCEVYSYAAKDAPGHVNQARAVLPMLLARAFALLDNPAGPAGDGLGAVAAAIGAVIAGWCLS